MGKTTLANYLKDSLKKESVYLDIENPEDQAKLTDPVLFMERNINKCLILDEIQRMPHLLAIHSFDTLESNPILGHSWEGYVIEQISGNLDAGTECYFYRTHEGAECDLVLLRSGQPIGAIEIKYTSSPKINRGLTQAFKDINAAANFIITPRTDDYLIHRSIRVCSLPQFLNSYLNQL